MTMVAVSLTILMVGSYMGVQRSNFEINEWASVISSEVSRLLKIERGRRETMKQLSPAELF
jgi:hypothetical protein